MQLPLWSPIPFFLSGVIAGASCSYRLQSLIPDGFTTKQAAGRSAISTVAKLLQRRTSVDINYHMRLLVARVLMICACLWRVEKLLQTDGILSSSGGRRRGWASVPLWAVLLSLVLETAASAVAFAWLLMAPTSYTRRQHAGHWCLLLVSCGAVMVRSAAQQLHGELSQRLDFLVLSIVLTVHQQETPLFMQQLGLMCAVCVSCELLTSNVAAGTQQPQDLADIGIFYLKASVGAAALQLLYRRCVKNGKHLRAGHTISSAAKSHCPPAGPAAHFSPSPPPKSRRLGSSSGHNSYADLMSLANAPPSMPTLSCNLVSPPLNGTSQAYNIIASSPHHKRSSSMRALQSCTAQRRLSNGSSGVYSSGMTTPMCPLTPVAYPDLSAAQRDVDEMHKSYVMKVVAAKGCAAVYIALLSLDVWQPVLQGQRLLSSCLIWCICLPVMAVLNAANALAAGFHWGPFARGLQSSSCHIVNNTVLLMGVALRVGGMWIGPRPTASLAHLRWLFRSQTFFALVPLSHEDSLACYAAEVWGTLLLLLGSSAYLVPGALDKGWVPFIQAHMQLLLVTIVGCVLHVLTSHGKRPAAALNVQRNAALNVQRNELVKHAVAVVRQWPWRSAGLSRIWAKTLGVRSMSTTISQALASKVERVLSFLGMLTSDDALGNSWLAQHDNETGPGLQPEPLRTLSMASVEDGRRHGLQTSVSCVFYEEEGLHVCANAPPALHLSDGQTSIASTPFSEQSLRQRHRPPRLSLDLDVTSSQPLETQRSSCDPAAGSSGKGCRGATNSESQPQPQGCCAGVERHWTAAPCTSPQAHDSGTQSFATLASWLSLPGALWPTSPKSSSPRVYRRTDSAALARAAAARDMLAALALAASACSAVVSYSRAGATFATRFVAVVAVLQLAAALLHLITQVSCSGSAWCARHRNWIWVARLLLSTACRRAVESVLQHGINTQEQSLQLFEVCAVTVLLQFPQRMVLSTAAAATLGLWGADSLLLQETTADCAIRMGTYGAAALLGLGLATGFLAAASQLASHRVHVLPRLTSMWFGSREAAASLGLILLGFIHFAGSVTGVLRACKLAARRLLHNLMSLKNALAYAGVSSITLPLVGMVRISGGPTDAGNSSAYVHPHSRSSQLTMTELAFGNFQIGEVVLWLAALLVGFVILTGLQTLAVVLARQPQPRAWLDLHRSTMAALRASKMDASALPELLRKLTEHSTALFDGFSVCLMEIEDSVVRVSKVHETEGLPVAPLCQIKPLEMLPSLKAACAMEEVLLTQDFNEEPLDFEDLQVVHSTLAADAMLLAPLCSGGCAIGGLLVLSQQPYSLCPDLMAAVADVAALLAQVLFVRRTLEEMQADEQLLQDIMPAGVTERLKAKYRKSMDQSREPPSHMSDDGVRAVVYQQWHPRVSVLFADIVGYTAMSQELEPEQVMLMLHDLFSKYDSFLGTHGVYKVETIGDCYMACTGLLVEADSHARNLVNFGKAMLKAASTVRNPLTGGPVNIRVGIHSGRVMSGVVGQCRSRYCLFGDTVNTASRMESTGVPGTIQVSDTTWQLLDEDHRQEFAFRGEVEVKGKGVMKTYLLRQESFIPAATSAARPNTRQLLGRMRSPLWRTVEHSSSQSDPGDATLALSAPPSHEPELGRHTDQVAPTRSCPPHLGERALSTEGGLPQSGTSLFGPWKSQDLLPAGGGLDGFWH